MSVRHPRAAVLAIWGLIVAFAITQAIAWAMLGGASGPAVFILQFVTPWLLILVLAFVSTRRIGGLTQTITRHEQAHRRVRRIAAQPRPLVARDRARRARGDRSQPGTRRAIVR